MIEKIIVALLFFSQIMLTFLMLTNPMKVNKKANTWLGIFILTWTTFFLDEMITIFYDTPIDLNQFFLLKLIQFTSPILFHISIQLFTNPSYRFNKKSLGYLILPSVYTIVFFSQSFQENNYKAILLSLLLTNSILYISRSIIKIRQHKKNIKLFSSNPEEYDLKWLEQIITALIIIVILITIFNLTFYNHPLNIYIYSTLLVSVYFIAYNVMKQKEIYPINEQQTNQVISISENVTSEDRKRKIVSDDKLIELKSEINTLMQNEKPYLNSELNLINLSDLLNISPHILSYVINTGYNVNFPQFVNKYRVENAKRLLLDKEKSKQLSMLGIAYESGFNSKTVFNTAFKKITGQTPSEYKKMCSNS